MLLENVLPLTGWCEEVSLTIPEPSCCNSPEPCEPPSTADGRRDLMLCILLLNRNGTLLLVFGIEPPCKIIISIFLAHNLIVLRALKAFPPISCFTTRFHITTVYEFSSIISLFNKTNSDNNTRW